MKRKSFREQMAAVIEKRYKNDSADSKKRYLAEATTPAAETLIINIRQWPSLYSSRNQALGHLIESHRWNDKGELVLERNFKGRAYPMELPLHMAYERYRFGDLRHTYFPSFSFSGALKVIPSQIAKDWEAEVKELFQDINGISISAVKIIALGKAVKSLGVGNPYTYVEMDRHVTDWKNAQTAIDAFAMNRKGWEYLTVASLQDPKPKQEMSKVLEDILAKADEVVEPSFKAIREQNRRLYIRQDATGARNHIKSLTGFFKKYGQTDLSGLTPVTELINSLEKQCLDAKPVKA